MGSKLSKKIVLMQKNLVHVIDNKSIPITHKSPSGISKMPILKWRAHQYILQVILNKTGVGGGGDSGFSPSVIGQFIYGNVKERRRWDQAIRLRCHGPFESWAVIRWYENKHGGPNETNKAFENKCYWLYEINIFRINNSRVRKVIHGWLSAWPAGSHRLFSWFPGSAKASPGNQETRRRDELVPQTINHGFPYVWYVRLTWVCFNY